VFHDNEMIHCSDHLCKDLPKKELPLLSVLLTHQISFKFSISCSLRDQNSPRNDTHPAEMGRLVTILQLYEMVSATMTASAS
jgi:hypothetical protein